MRILDTLSRWGRLGAFVGWGAALAVWGACSSSTTGTKIDARKDFKKQTDGGVSDRSGSAAEAMAPDSTASPDRAPLDFHAPDRKLEPDHKGWDIPLE
jgi:hypothetical protein